MGNGIERVGNLVGSRFQAVVVDNPIKLNPHGSFDFVETHSNASLRDRWLGSSPRPYDVVDVVGATGRSPLQNRLFQPTQTEDDNSGALFVLAAAGAIAVIQPEIGVPLFLLALAGCQGQVNTEARGIRVNGAVELEGGRSMDANFTNPPDATTRTPTYAGRPLSALYAGANAERLVQSAVLYVGPNDDIYVSFGLAMTLVGEDGQITELSLCDLKNFEQTSPDGVRRVPVFPFLNDSTIAMHVCSAPDKCEPPIDLLDKAQIPHQQSSKDPTANWAGCALGQKLPAGTIKGDVKVGLQLVSKSDMKPFGNDTENYPITWLTPEIRFIDANCRDIVVPMEFENYSTLGLRHSWSEKSENGFFTSNYATTLFVKQIRGFRERGATRLYHRTNVVGFEYGPICDTLSSDMIDTFDLESSNCRQVATPTYQYSGILSNPPSREPLKWSIYFSMGSSNRPIAANDDIFTEMKVCPH